MWKLGMHYAQENNNQIKIKSPLFNTTHGELHDN